MKLTGFDELERNLKALGKDVATRVGRAASRAGANELAKAMRDAAPVGPTPEGAQSGYARKDGSRGSRTHAKLKSSIKVRNGRVTSSTKVKHIIHTGDAYHAWIVERGSIHMPPKLWAKPALEAASPRAIDAIKRTLERRIRRGR